jgi:hypothetical protein
MAPFSIVNVQVGDSLLFYQRQACQGDTPDVWVELVDGGKRGPRGWGKVEVGTDEVGPGGDGVWLVQRAGGRVFG